MAKEKQVTQEVTTADLASAFVSLSDKIDKLANAVINNQAGNQNNQQAALASTLAEMISKSSSMRDTDVNAEEAMKSYSPMWGLKANALFAQEFFQLTTAHNHGIQILQNAISQANQLGLESMAAAGRRIGMADKLLLTAVNHPTYFAENAPASQDTGGEGDDTGDSK